jgi:hypothetical protein
MQPSSPKLPQGSKQPKNHIAINPSPSPTKRIAMEKRSSISQTFGQSPKVLRIGVEPDVVGGAALRLHDADGVDQSGGGLHLRTRCRPLWPFVPQKSILAKGQRVRTWAAAEPAEMQDKKEKDAREPSLEAAASKTLGYGPSL